MKPELFLENETAKRIYAQVSALPIVDYHCHLSPKEIFEDRPFDNIAQMWLSGDHYKWRLMRAAGLDERYITGDALDEEKFRAYAKAIALAAGNPLYHWTMMELSRYFAVDIPLNEETAGEIWEKANRIIREKQLSPRKLIEEGRVEAIATTDDPADPLEWHPQIAADASFRTRITPTFRADRIANLQAADYPSYIKRLGQTAAVEITDLSGLEQAILRRLDDFEQAGCRMADVGVEAFPEGDCDRAEAGRLFGKAIGGERPSDGEQRAFLSWLYPFLAAEYKRRGMVMQLHIAVKRNANRALLAECGADSGGDCVGDAIPVSRVIALLDRMNESGLPRTILYPLDAGMNLPLASAAGSFNNVCLGAAWWFNDHRDGIEAQLKTYAQTSLLAAFPGMLTDSRSFLSYARHDYFRRILCTLLGSWVENGEFPDEQAAIRLAKKICYENSHEMMSSCE